MKLNRDPRVQIRILAIRGWAWQILSTEVPYNIFNGGWSGSVIRPNATFCQCWFYAGPTLAQYKMGTVDHQPAFSVPLGGVAGSGICSQMSRPGGSVAVASPLPPGLPCGTVPLVKAKKQKLFTFQVSRYCLWICGVVIVYMIMHSGVRANANVIRIQIRYATLRYATLRYATLRYDTIRYATLRYAALRCAALRYDTIRYDTIRYDTIRYDTIRYAAPRCDTIRYDTIRYDTIRYDTIRYDTKRYDTIRYDTIRYDTIRYDTIRYDTIRYDTIRYDTIRYDTIRYDTIRYDTIGYHLIGGPISEAPHNEAIWQKRLWCDKVRFDFIINF